MSVENNKAVLKRLYEEVWNKGDLSVIPELVSPDYHYGDYKGLEGYRQVVTMQRDAFPDVRFIVDKVIGEGDWLAYQLTTRGTLKGKLGNIEPTGKEVSWKRAFFAQYKDGKTVTTEVVSDTLGFYQKIGVKPPGFEQSVEQNKATLKRMYDEVWNKRNLSVASELISPDYHHGDYKGPEGWKQIVTLQRNAFPDIHYTVGQVIGEGDWLAYKLTVQGTFNGKGEIWGVKPTGKSMKWEWWFFSEYKDGKLLSSTASADALTFYQQVGASPPGWEIKKK